MAKVPTADLNAYLDRRQSASPYASKEQAANSLVKHFGIKQARANDVAAKWWPTRTQSTPPPPSPPPPTAAFIRSPANPMNPPVAVNFDASASTGTGLTYEWFHGTTKFADGVRASFTYQSVGTKTVTLRVTDSAQQRVVLSQTFVVAASTVPPPDPTPPPPPTPGLPAFLNGRTKAWADPCVSARPVEDKLWGEYAAGRNDGREQTSHAIGDIKPGRIVHHANGGVGDAPFWEHYAPSGDGIWTPGSAGRSEMSYAGAGSPNEQDPNGGTYWFHQGDHRVIRQLVKLPVGWDLNANAWRLVLQIKVNEGKYPMPHGSPMWALHQFGGKWRFMQYGNSTSMEWAAVANTWTDFAFDIQFSTGAGKVTIYQDVGADGTYDKVVDGWTGQTLAPDSSGAAREHQYMRGLYEANGGDRVLHGRSEIWA